MSDFVPAEVTPPEEAHFEEDSQNSTLRKDRLSEMRDEPIVGTLEGTIRTQ